MKDVIYYNLWGKDLEAKLAELQEKFVVPFSDQKYVTPAYNEEAFVSMQRSILQDFQTSVLTGCNHSKYLESRIRWLGNLHANYLNRLAEAQILPEQQLQEAVDKWATRTKELLLVAANQLENGISSPNNVPEKTQRSNPGGYARWLETRPLILKALQDAIDQSSTCLKQSIADRNERPDKAKKPPLVSFRGNIKRKDKVEDIMSILHANIDGKSGIKACIYIQAAIEAEIFFDRPNYAQANEEFPGLATRSIYDRYVGARCDIHEKHYQTMDEFISKLEALLTVGN